LSAALRWTFFAFDREVPNVHGDSTLHELRHAVPRPLVDDQAYHYISIRRLRLRYALHAACRRSVLKCSGREQPLACGASPSMAACTGDRAADRPRVNSRTQQSGADDHAGPYRRTRITTPEVCRAQAVRERPLWPIRLAYQTSAAEIFPCPHDGRGGTAGLRWMYGLDRASYCAGW
jgi:hypothetical protein